MHRRPIRAGRKPPLGEYQQAWAADFATGQALNEVGALIYLTGRDQYRP